MLKAFKKNSKIICYVLAFIIPIIFMLIVSSAMEFSPFSWRAPLVGDTVAQFYPFYSYLKTIIFNNNDLFYTFSKTMGGDMAGFASYYLNSPFNFFLLLFPNGYIFVHAQQIIQVITGRIKDNKYNIFSFLFSVI